VSVTSRKAGGLGGLQGQVSPSRDMQGGPPPGAQGAPLPAASNGGSPSPRP
jgi:hypothetical protein